MRKGIGILIKVIKINKCMLLLKYETDEYFIKNGIENRKKARNENEVYESRKKIKK